MVSCIEPYNFKALETDRALVIDASLTDLNEVQFVYLNYSYPIDTTELDPAGGAIVAIEASNGTEYSFTETNTVVYQSDVSFGAISGVSYRLNVNLQGQQYQSLWETATAAVPIDSIYGEYVTIPSADNGGFLSGVQFFIDSYDASGQSTRFRYEWEEDYRILTPFPTWYYYEPADSSVYKRSETFDVCFANDTNKSMILSTTEGLSEPRITELPIRFADEQYILLHRRYALTIRQYSLSATAYNYYKHLKENNESAGTFFDKQKGAINGNITAANDPSEIVLGFFEVSGVSVRRQYFSQLDFKEQGFKISSYPGCDQQLDVDTVNVSNMPQYFQSECIGCLIVWELEPPGSGNFVVVAPECADCRFLGVQDQPTWWEN